MRPGSQRHTPLARQPLLFVGLVGALCVGLLACAGSLAERAKNGEVAAQRELGRSFLGATPTDLDADTKPRDSAADREAAYWLRRAAKQRDPTAQRLLAELYYRGQGVSQDFGKAEHWARLAADSGDAEAQGFLGGLYRLGRGVPPDLKEAILWYRRAAEQGHAASEFHLAAAYDFGAGVEANLETARSLYTRAADQGHHQAQYNLAISYLVDPREAPAPAMGLKWLFIASRTGSLQASEKLLEVRRVYRGEDLAKAHRMARSWLDARGIPELRASE